MTQGHAVTKKERWWVWMVVVGAIVRVGVFYYQRPFNNDHHLDNVIFFLTYGRLPFAHETTQGFQSPLYYLLAVPWLKYGSFKVVQCFSVCLSIANLVVLGWCIERTTVVSGRFAKLHALILAALLPQFILFGNSISNDALTFLVASFLILQTFRVLEDPSPARIYILGVLEGVGLLTKSTFLGLVPAVCGVVALVELRHARPWSARLRRMGVFLIIVTALGGYKYAENIAVFGRPFVTPPDIPWVHVATGAASQTGTYQGWRSWCDINLLRLLEHPTVGPDTWHSYPLMLFATTWYPYIDSETNFSQAATAGYRIVPQLTYLGGLIVTLLTLAGAFWCVWDAIAPHRCHSHPEAFASRSEVGVLFWYGAFNLGTVLAAGLVTDQWSTYQGRYLFPCILLFLVCYGRGVDWVADKGRSARFVVNGLLGVAYATMIGFLAVEILLKAA